MSGRMTAWTSAPRCAPRRRRRKAGRRTRANSPSSSGARSSCRRRSRRRSSRASLGGIYEIRMYTYAPGTLPAVMERWAEKVPGRIALSPLVGAWYSELGGLNKWCHIWAYKDAGERGRIRAEAVAKGVWPPGGAAGRAAEAGEHAGCAGRVLAAEVAAQIWHVSCCDLPQPQTRVAGGTVCSHSSPSPASSARWHRSPREHPGCPPMSAPPRQPQRRAATAEAKPQTERQGISVRDGARGTGCRADLAGERRRCLPGKGRNAIRHSLADPRHRLRYACPDASRHGRLQSYRRPSGQPRRGGRLDGCR